ncbi:PD-(D/E)XK nuclease family transposase, partial [Breznakiellaceae bacterium SP9]
KPLFNDAEFFHEFQYYDRERDITLGGRTRIIFIELSKLDAALEKQALQMTAKEHWAVYFKHNGDKDKEALINEILKEEEGIAMAQEEYLTITRDERERARLRSELKYILDKQSAEAEAEEFIEEAREQAEQERKRAESVEKKLVAERKRAEQERKQAEQEQKRAESAEKELVAERERAEQAEKKLVAERKQAESTEKKLVAERARTAQEREQAIAAMRTLGLSDKDIERIYQGK